MGVLMSSTIGGAIGPLAVGQLADFFGLRTGMVVIYPAFLFLAYLGLWTQRTASTAPAGQQE